MTRQLKSRKKIAILVSIVLVILLVTLELTGRTNLFLDRGAKGIDRTSKTTSDVESAQSDYKDGDDRKVMDSNTKTDAGVTDTRGASVASNSQPLKSDDGVIAVYSPARGELFTNGSSLSGSASGLAKVSYRLIDNVSGVSATGTLDVINGNFSGKFTFSTKATEGRLDVFQTSPGGIEQSIVEIPVRFK